MHQCVCYVYVGTWFALRFNAQYKALHIFFTLDMVRCNDDFSMINSN